MREDLLNIGAAYASGVPGVKQKRLWRAERDSELGGVTVRSCPMGLKQRYQHRTGEACSRSACVTAVRDVCRFDGD